MDSLLPFHSSECTAPLIRMLYNTEIVNHWGLGRYRITNDIDALSLDT